MELCRPLESPFGATMTGTKTARSAGSSIVVSMLAVSLATTGLWVVGHCVGFAMESKGGDAPCCYEHEVGSVIHRFCLSGSHGNDDSDDCDVLKPGSDLGFPLITAGELLTPILISPTLVDEPVVPLEGAWAPTPVRIPLIPPPRA